MLKEFYRMEGFPVRDKYKSLESLAKQFIQQQVVINKAVEGLRRSAKAQRSRILQKTARKRTNAER